MNVTAGTTKDSTYTVRDRFWGHYVECLLLKRAMETRWGKGEF